jgi:hypothetical protein
MPLLEVLEPSVWRDNLNIANEIAEKYCVQHTVAESSYSMPMWLNQFARGSKPSYGSASRSFYEYGLQRHDTSTTGEKSHHRTGMLWTTWMRAERSSTANTAPDIRRSHARLSENSAQDRKPASSILALSERPGMRRVDDLPPG